MRIMAGVLGAVFLVAALVQWNDPDPFVWIVGYLVAAGLSAAAATGRSLLIPNAVASLIFLIWFLSLASSLVNADSAAFQSFQMTEASQEEPREAVGIALAAIWCAILAWHSRVVPGNVSE